MINIKTIGTLTFYGCFFMGIISCNPAKKLQPSVLKDAFDGKFYIGTAMDSAQIIGADTGSIRLIQKQFNAIVAENIMKSEEIQPEEGVFNFKLADQFVEFGEKNDMFITGHVLIWHSQLPEWFCTDDKGNNVSPETLKQHMKTHISTLVGRYKGRVKGWDVVNEAIENDGSWRKNKFYQILGEDYIRLAFEYAREADPDAELYYNDYSMTVPGRRDAVVKMILNLKQQGIKVDGIGMQGHMNMHFPTIGDFEKSILAFAGTGAKVMITEMDITVLPAPGKNAGADVSLNFKYDNELNPYTNGLPDSVANALYNRYVNFFRLFLKHKDKISRVTLWGVSDRKSWRNDWPISGRTDYPLLFDRNLKPKPMVETIIRETGVMSTIK